ncbi:hypothetical protein AB0K52_07925 [Glycomyces sp. NPDC049804]
MSGLLLIVQRSATGRAGIAELVAAGRFPDRGAQGGVSRLSAD